MTRKESHKVDRIPPAIFTLGNCARMPEAKMKEGKS